MSIKKKILFICQHNSGRSQIAESYLGRLFGEHFQVESAGLEPATGVNPLVVQVMAEEGFDLSTKLPQSVFELFKAGKLFDHVVTVCSDSEDQCPLFPGITKRWHWPFPDPAKGVGADDEKLAEVRRIRDMIKDWLQNPPPGAIDFQSLIDE
jgi:arsenate reductase